MQPQIVLGIVAAAAPDFLSLLAVGGDDAARAPMALRFDCVPTSFSVIQWRSPV